jgi:FkbM family methyltransferase
MDLKGLAYRILPKSLLEELRHRKHLRDLATAVEPEEPAVRPLILSGQTVLDIGANFGVFTKLFSELVGPSGSVLAFEPVPQTFRTLAAGVQRFQLRNVQVMNKAVSDHIGTASMRVPHYAESKGENLYEARIVNDSQGEFRVETVTIDSLQLSRVDFIKIDVEGHELEVLRGGRGTLEREHPTLMVEVTSQRTVEFLCGEMDYEQPVIVSPSNQLFTHARN